MPLGLRVPALQAWLEYLRRREEVRGTLVPPQPRGEKDKEKGRGARVPWEEDGCMWSGSFDAGAREVVEVGMKGGGCGGKLVKMEERADDRYIEKGWAGDDGRLIDVRDGHVMGRDWASERRVAMLVHEEKTTEAKDAESKESVSTLDRMIGTLKRALLS